MTNHYLIHSKRKNQKWICLIYYGTQLIKATKTNPDLGKVFHEAQSFVFQKTINQED